MNDILYIALLRMYEDQLESTRLDMIRITAALEDCDSEHAVRWYKSVRKKLLTCNNPKLDVLFRHTLNKYINAALGTKYVPGCPAVLNIRHKLGQLELS